MKTYIKKMALALVGLISVSNLVAQTTAMNFSGQDCNGNNVDLFTDLEAGKAVMLIFYMPNCGSCPPVAQKMQTMANNINANQPGRVKAYSFPYQNSTTCTYSATWVTSNNLSLFTPMDSGAVQVAYYGGFGMPTVVLLDGSTHDVKFVTQDFNTSDTTTMRDLILGNAGLNDELASENKVQLFPNPASKSFTVSLDGSYVEEISISTLDGKVVKEVICSKNNTIQDVDVSALESGNYIVTISTEKGNIKKSLNIQH